MDSDKFYNDLTTYIKSNDIESANAVIMNELGILLVKDRENFIALLNNSGLQANDAMSDVDLIQLFINNIHNNRALIIGTAFLISHSKKIIGFDGEEEISDAGTKAMNKVMYSYFDTALYPDSADNYYNAGGGLIGAISDAAKEGFKFGNKISENVRSKKHGAEDMLAKKAEAKQQLIESVIAQRKAQAEAANKIKLQQEKNKKIAIIAVSSVLGLTLIGLLIYKFKH